MSTLPPVYIVAATRTPIGAFQGALSSIAAPKLGAAAIAGALANAKLDPAAVGQVFMGNVLSAGQGQAPARQAMIHAGIPNSVPATTVSKVCGSGMEALILGARALALGDADVVVAGGMESMSNVPYYLPGARNGYRMGHQQVQDGMIHDGLWDVYNNYHMGNAAELCARELHIDRAAQDAYAAESYRRALAAIAAGKFQAEIAPVEVAKVVWRAYHEDKLHWYVPEELAQYDQQATAHPEQVRDQMANSRTGIPRQP